MNSYPGISRYLTAETTLNLIKFPWIFHPFTCFWVSLSGQTFGPGLPASNALQLAIDLANVSHLHTRVYSDIVAKWKENEKKVRVVGLARVLNMGENGEMSASPAETETTVDAMDTQVSVCRPFLGLSEYSVQWEGIGLYNPCGWTV